jgi:hypothetical protein
LVSRPHLPKEGPIEADPAPTGSKAPEADENQDGDEAERSLEESDSTMSPPPAVSKDKDLEKKRKRVGDVASSSTSFLKDASVEPATARDSEPDMFELLPFVFQVFLFLTLLLLLLDVEWLFL